MHVSLTRTSLDAERAQLVGEQPRERPTAPGVLGTAGVTFSRLRVDAHVPQEAIDDGLAGRTEGRRRRHGSDSGTRGAPATCV